RWDRLTTTVRGSADGDHITRRQLTRACPTLRGENPVILRTPEFRLAGAEFDDRLDAASIDVLRPSEIKYFFLLVPDAHRECAARGKHSGSPERVWNSDVPVSPELRDGALPHRSPGRRDA